MGRLELCQNGAWGTVNNNMFSVKDSLVACRQMGVPSPCEPITVYMYSTFSVYDYEVMHYWGGTSFNSSAIDFYGYAVLK